MINSELTIDTVIAFVTASIYLESCALSSQEDSVSIVRNDKESISDRKKIAEAMFSCSIRTKITNNEGDF